MRSLVILALAIAGAAGAAHPNISADQSPAQSHLLKVARTYLGGDTAAAIELLRGDAIEGQRRIAREVVQTHGIVVGGSAPAELRWTLPLLRAAGAVHMESALDHYKRGGRNQQVIIAQMEVGEILLDEVGRLEAKASDAQRWEWAIGEQILSDGQFHGARAVLTRACQRYPHQPALLVACGTVYETFASFNLNSAAVTQAFGGMTGMTSEPEPSALLSFRAARKDELKRARDAFEEAVSLEFSNPEATLRLGKVRLEQGDLDDAAKALDWLVHLRTDLRVTYLSRLFLGRAREKQKRFDEAIVLFREATTVIAAQSALLALTNRLHAAGREPDALALAEAVTGDREHEDPWWSYRHGQYWLVEPALELLREQTRATGASAQQSGR